MWTTPVREEVEKNSLRLFQVLYRLFIDEFTDSGKHELYSHRDDEYSHIA